jgi:uncharacterized repeat protein (TIGR01451 family)
MTNQMRLLASASLLAVAALGATPVLAAGTVAGTDITNSVNVNYNVGGIAQTAEPSNTDSFKVDRKVIMTLVETDGITTSVGPGQAGAVIAYTLTNASNDELDFALAVAQPAGGSGPHGGTDTFDTSNVRIWVDTNGVAGLQTSGPGADTEMAWVDNLAADSSRMIFVMSDVPLGPVTNNISIVTLSATASAAGAVGSQGAALSNDSGSANNNATVQNVFADGIGATDGDKDGIISAQDDYTVTAANLTVNKTSTIISDPISASNPKMIPGAVVEYCITVANAAGSATATNIVITDTLPANTTFQSNSVYLDGDGSCQNGTNTAGAPVAGTLTMPLADIAGNSTLSARFRVTVD